MKRIIIFFGFFFLTVNSKSQGLIFDSTGFSKREKIEETRTELPISTSLKKYAPLLYPQVGSTCVAHSFANARTILLAKNRNWTDIKKITSLSFSPYYIYYRNKEYGDVNCSGGLNIESAARDVLKNGLTPIIEVEYPHYYPFTDTALCIEGKGSLYPPSLSEDVAYAKQFKLDEIYRVTSITELKTALAAGMPVIVCMYSTASFKKVKGDIWMPQITDKIDKNMGHSLIAIGYDETKYGGAIELMNSWGDTWGNKGFVWVKYKDYIKWFLGGYALYVDNSIKLKDANNQEFKPEGSKIEKKIMKVNGYDGKNKIKFDNTKFLNAFEY